MRPLRGLSIAEQIVVLFEDRVTEATRWAIQAPLDITGEQFDQAIGRARDLGVERGLRLTPIYERDGWWTSEPTRRIAAIAVYEAVTRNWGEAKRNARVYADFDPAGESALAHSSVVNGSIHMLEKQMPELEITAESDYILARVDQAVAAKRGYVERNGVSA